MPVRADSPLQARRVTRVLIVSNRLHNVKDELGTAHFNFGYSYAFRADQWYIKE